MKEKTEMCEILCQQSAKKCSQSASNTKNQITQKSSESMPRLLTSFKIKNGPPHRPCVGKT